MVNSNSPTRLLIVGVNFWPEPSGISLYTTDLASHLQSNGYEVSVLTGLPHYPWWRVPVEFQHLHAGDSDYRGIRLMRVSHKIPSGTSAVGRAVLEFSFWLNAIRRTKNLANAEFDGVIAVTPAVASGLVARKIAKRMKIPGVVIFQDVSSAGARQSGIPGGRVLSFIAGSLERRASRWAKEIAVVSPEMLKSVEQIALRKVPIKVIYNYTLSDFPETSPSIFREKFGFAKDEFLVMHTGNMGFKQDLDNVVAAARLISSNEKIGICLIGHGNQENVIRGKIEDLTNVILLPSVKAEEYPSLLSCADVLLVNERSTQTSMSLPSKLTSYLAASRPVLAAVPTKGATSQFLTGIAEIVPAGDPQALANAIFFLRNDSDRRELLATKGYVFAQQYLTARAGRAHYLDWVNKVFKE